MIRPLRRAHYWVWLVLPAVLLALLAAGVLSRVDPQP